MKKVVIIGASSGIGQEIARMFLSDGYVVGVTGRRVELLDELVKDYPDRCFPMRMDICLSESVERLDELIRKMGGVDILIHSSGIGWQNIQLDPQKELCTVSTNVEGFVRILTHMFNYFRYNAGGHIVAITSIAGTKGLGSAPAYSATKRFQRHYLQCLAQLSIIERCGVLITDIRPGFVKTDLLNGKNFPLQMDVKFVARQVVKAVKQERRICTIDWRYRIIVFFWRMIPEYVWERLRVK